MIKKYIIDIIALRDIPKALYELDLDWTKINWVKVEKTEDDYKAIITIDRNDK